MMPRLDGFRRKFLKKFLERDFLGENAHGQKLYVLLTAALQKNTIRLYPESFEGKKMGKDPDCILWEDSWNLPFIVPTLGLSQ